MKTNAYLIEYVTAQIGRPYWFGTYGQKGTKALYTAKKKQYPKYYTAKNYASQYGKKVHDCAGLIKGALWSATPNSTPKYNAKQDYGATGFYNAAKKKGKIATFDKVNGRLVFKGNDKTKTHVGVYVNGYVIEAKGHAYGVVKTKFNAKSWPYWAQCHLFKAETAQNDAGNNQTIKDPKNDADASQGKIEAIYLTVNTNKSSLNMRATPAGKIIGSVSKGKKVELISKSNAEWYKVKYNGKTGYCYSKYLKA